VAYCQEHREREGKDERPHSEENTLKLTNEHSEVSRGNDNNGVQNPASILLHLGDLKVEMDGSSSVGATAPEGGGNGGPPKAEKGEAVEITPVAKEEPSEPSIGESTAVEFNNDDNLPGERSKYVSSYLGPKPE